jgi:hypothetical protein
MDVFNEERLSGWAVEEQEMDKRYAFDLYMDDHFQIRLFAHQFRADLKQHGVGDGRYSFQYRFSPLIRAKKPRTITLRDAESGVVVFEKTQGEA